MISKIFSNPDIEYDEVRKALESFDSWRYHGIGVLQKYVGEKRIHIWHPDLIQIGEEGAIHNHRYDIFSDIVYGEIFQVEYTLEESIKGLWKEWIHGNTDTKSYIPVPVDNVFYNIKPKTIKVKEGQSYSFPKGSYHRSYIENLTITIITRENKSGRSSALIPINVIPVNGLECKIDEKIKIDILSKAKKIL